MPTGLSVEIYLISKEFELRDKAAYLRALADQKRKEQEDLAKQFNEAFKISSVRLEDDKEWMQAVHDKNNARLEELAKKRDWAYQLVSS